MSLMRKMFGQRGTDSASTAQDNSLGLMHLRKLFADVRHPVTGTTQKLLEDKLYNMLPLFCKIFGSAASSEMTQKFPDILQFCSHVSRLMVSEIRRRASNQSTDAASCAIVKFLEIESTEESSNGWMLLSTINLLSSGQSSLIDCMTAASLPSTIVKCLYLFFDLPDVQNADVLEEECEFTPRERRVLLQKIFVQVLVRLCSHVSPADELARKDDLALLFSAITSWCPQHNVPWRKSAAEVLMTLSRHGLTPNVVQYIHNKGCLGLCIDNMQRVQELSPIELVEMFVTVFCFLKDSSEVSQMLLDDFRGCQGYIFLTDFLLRMETNESEEAIQALRNLVLLVGSLSSCGYIELKPSTASSASLFQMPGFTVPPPTGKGVSVRNIQAFQVLQTVFMKSGSVHLCSTILDVISSIYHQDNANYFILEPQNTLSQFAEKIHIKPVDIQVKFFEMIEFIVFNLNFVPCKELISLSLLIKTNHCAECSILCMRTLLKILRHHAVYRDVYREVGLLEVIVTCLHRFAALLKEPSSAIELGGLQPQEREMGFLVMEGLVQLLSGNSSNAGVFRECGGARCAHNMVPHPACRQQALSIVQQLVVCNGGDDDMGTLLGLMHTAPTIALELKTHILKSLLHVLRESHRTRTVFRKVGGFVYVMSVLVSMEGCLANPPKAPWHTACRKDVVQLLKMVFSCLTVAMRYEPANARFFATEVRYASLTEAVRLLGCFSCDVDIQPVLRTVQVQDTNTEFSSLFANIHQEGWPTPRLPQMLVSACLMLRYLYDMALDTSDKPQHAPTSVTAGSDSPNMKRMSSILDSSTELREFPPVVKRASTGSLVLSLCPSTPEPLIVHAGAVISMLHLVPAITSDDQPQLALELQCETCEVIKSLVRTERNQQVMCEAGLPHELLTHCTVTLADERHPLHPTLQYIFERLAAQCLTPKDLRDFLRLGAPLCCNSEWEEDVVPDSVYSGVLDSWADKQSQNVVNRRCTNGGPIPLTRVKCLVSMTTPRDVRLHGSTITPAFVEFDMSAEGFGCLYLPSIAPQGPPTPSVVGAGMIVGSDPGVVGGIGTGERLFPPQSGLSFSTWVCVDKFSSPVADPHPVRLLSIVRNIQGREDCLICLNVFLAPRDRALFVSTREQLMPANVGELDMEPALRDTTVRFWCPEFTQEGQWRHLVLVFHKAGIMKNSSVTLYIDGVAINTQKLHYISPNLGGTGTASPNAATYVFAYIGTPPQLRRQSRLLWRQGPCHLFEDGVSPAVVQYLYAQGPNYVGSFQLPTGTDGQHSVLPEERMMFGVHAHAMSLMTVAKIRKVYNKVDAKSIAKQLGMPAHENATPIRILHNSAGHLSGSARSFGAILMGYLGVRTFCPKPVAKMVMNIGGSSALLGLIAMTTDVEGLYAAVKALVCVVRSNKAALLEMERIKGYQILGLLFKKKRHLLNSHILHLTFSLVGTVDSGRETTVIPNTAAFEDLLCNLQVWHEAPGDLERSLYEHFYELLTESSEQKTNLRLMQEMGLVGRLLPVMEDMQVTRLALHTLTSVTTVLLSGPAHPPSLLRFGQFMVSLIPLSALVEHGLCVDVPTIEQKPHSPQEGELFDNSGSHDIFNVRLRNNCLDVILKLLTAPPITNHANQYFSDELQKILGFDWLGLFMQGHLHSTTVQRAVRLLLIMLQHPATMTRFRDGGTGGGWLHNTESVLHNRAGVLLGFNVGARNAKGESRGVNRDICQLPGFTMLQWLLPHHAHIPELYLLLISLLLGQPIKDLPHKLHFDLDTVWTFIFGVPASQPLSKSSKGHKMELCGDAALVILAMVRAMLNKLVDEEVESYLTEFPVTLMQFLLFLYHNQPDFVPLCMTADFLTALASTVFPYRNSLSESNSELSTPVEDFRPFPGSDTVVLVKTGERSPAGLSTHPANKFVVDFLRMIIMDSLPMSPSSKNPPTIDVILETTPDQSSSAQRSEFQTMILTVLMEHLVAADVLLGDQAAVAAPSSGGTYSHTATNVFYLAGRVIDKLWQGAYIRDPKGVFEFISKLISQAKRKASGVSLDAIYKCLNRTILYQLSRPMHTMADQTNILDALHSLTNSRSLVFGPGNYDQEFVGCLTHCLLELSHDPTTLSNPPNLRTTTWHVDEDSSNVDEGHRGSLLFDPTKNEQVMQLLRAAARRVWEELYFSKKPVLEEIFKVSFTNQEISTPSNKHGTPELLTIRPMLEETTARLWLTYLDNEQKCFYSQAERLQSQLQSKLQKVGHGVLRFATRKTKKEAPVKSLTMTRQQSAACSVGHVNIVKDLVTFQHKQFQQSVGYMEGYLVDDWNSMETELLRERGLWGPVVGSNLDKWMLDMTEGQFRMRKKMIRNEAFYLEYPYRPPNADGKPTKYKMAVCYDSRLYYERFRSHSLVGDETLPPAELLVDISENISHDNDELVDDVLAPPTLLPKLPARRRHLTEPTGEDEEDGDMELGDKVTGEGGKEGEIGGEAGKEGEGSMDTDNQMILRLLEEGEKISHMFRCARIQGLDTMEGLLLFGKEHYYIVDGFTLLRTREIADIDSLPPEMHDPIIPRTATGAERKKMCYKFSYDQIREVHKRRYLLLPIAIEVFSADGRNLLLAFPRKVRNKVHHRYMMMATDIKDSAQESVSGQRQGAKVEPGTGLLNSLIGEKSVTQRWERGEISNFEYLMCLNTLAGRSYNDLMQYPVFPWILADYESEELDLNEPGTFRDLAKPMGAQTPDRLLQFHKRYQDWDDPQGETPPYHYGTHYSSAMIVASYLVRMEPFTQIFLKLQGGHFDLADRMFHSVKDAWFSASKHNMADVKELIPEFFYLPEFLNNSNNFDLGVKQSGVALGDILLPTWAKGDAREFIRVHREALECDYVSAHLHEWIDLIFGYKQQGSPAVDSVNVFHHLFYEGNVDIDLIDDPLKKNAIIGFINNFGQIPKQLFKKPHPQKKLSLRYMEPVPLGSLFSNSTDRLFFNNLDNLRPTMQPLKELRGPVGQIMHPDKVMLAVEQNKVLIPPTFNRYLAWGFSDMSIRVGCYDSDKAVTVYENLTSGDILCAACPNAKTVITAGTSTVVQVWEFCKVRDRRVLSLQAALYGHTEPVTCLAASSAWNIIVSGSRDRTCLLWDLSRLAFVRQLKRHAAPVAALAINEQTGDIATCAGTYLHVWNINGEEVACINTATGRNQQILCVAMSQAMEWDAHNVIMTGNSDGVVRMWSLEFVEVADTRLRPKEVTLPPHKAAPGQKAAVPGYEFGSAEDLSVADRLQGFKDPDFLATQTVELGSSADSEGGNPLESLKEQFRDLTRSKTTSGEARPPTTLGYDHMGGSDALFRLDDLDAVSVSSDKRSTSSTPWGERVESAVDVVATLTPTPSVDISFSQSPKKDPTSPGADFVMVTDTEVKDAVSSALTHNVAMGTPPSATHTPPGIATPPRSSSHVASPPPAHKKGRLRDGFTWQRQLVFRSKLTMHTAFERKDNKDPAAVTSLAVSKDHRSVYVGDAKGRVFGWCVTDQPGRVVADHWVKDDGGDSCISCNIKFSFSERRHHCRNCGQLFCSRCSRFETEIRRLRIMKPVRVCQTCYNTLKAQQAQEALLRGPPVRT